MSALDTLEALADPANPRGAALADIDRALDALAALA